MSTQRQTVFIVRHQAGGHFVEAIFADRPTKEQLEEVHKELEIRHGKGHPSLEGDWWHKVVELPVIQPGETVMPFRGASAEGGAPGEVAPSPGPIVTAVAHVGSAPIVTERDKAR